MPVVPGVSPRRSHPAETNSSGVRIQHSEKAFATRCLNARRNWSVAITATVAQEVNNGVCLRY